MIGKKTVISARDSFGPLNYEAYITIQHELGHNLGAKGDKTCVGPCAMSYSQRDPNKWCSKCYTEIMRNNP